MVYGLLGGGLSMNVIIIVAICVSGAFGIWNLFHENRSNDWDDIL